MIRLMRWSILCGLLIGGLTQAVGQKIKVIDELSEPIEGVEAYVHTGSKDIQFVSDVNGIINVTLASYDSVVFNHQSHKSVTMSFSALKEQRFHVVMSLLAYRYEPFEFRHNQDFEFQKDQPNKLVRLTPKQTTFYNPQTTADLLALSNQVFIQKSQMGGGSPMIRGFAANNVLIVVDGVRMNNAIFRDGNVQNIITLDPNLINETQIVFGPGSVFYGSDAMGGVMAFETKNPKIDSQSHYQGNVMLRTASANRESSWHVDLSYGKGKIAGLSSISLSNYGDLKMGSNGPSEYTRPTFSEYNGHTDSIIQNKDPNVQYFSGYSQINVNQKFRYQPDSLNDFIAHFGFTTSSPIPRYDRLIQMRNNLPRYGDWLYGPQKWTQMNVRHIRSFPSNKIVDQLTTTVAHQIFEESRLVRLFRSFHLEENKERVNVSSINLDFDKKFGEIDVLYGLELVANKVASTGKGSQIDSGFTYEIATRYPDQSAMNTAAVYVSVKRKLSDKFLATMGGRYSYVDLKAPFDNSFYDFPFSEIHLQKSAFSGSLGVRRLIGKKSFVYTSIASGFRAPNIDDMGKIFDSQPDRVSVPNAQLQPEYSYTGEIGLHAMFFKRYEVLLNAYYTVIDNIITRADFALNGQDSLDYGGQTLKIQSLVNAQQGDITGYELQLKTEITQDIDFKTSYNIISGSTETGVPIRHITPNFGNTSLSWKNTKFKIIAYANYNARLSNDKLAPTEQSKVHLYAFDGDGLPYSPAWMTLNIKTGVTFSKSLKLNIGLENILNKRYRPYSSGISAPGRNLSIALYGKF
ncbi:MAG: hemoglobin/transferrin/lactoferrin receptor protein [Bacteroidia bacterium]|jgi:hemoglobin/transferrin/lactoferrin receptor protein